MRWHLNARPLLIGVMLVGVCLWLQLTTQPGVAALRERLDLLAYDLRLNAALSLDTASATPIVIVDIDEASLQQEGQWPWPRQRIAELVAAIRAAGAAVLAFDMLFAEAERNPRDALLATLDSNDPQHAALRDQLQTLPALGDGNQALADSLAGYDAVLGIIFHNQGNTAVGQLPAPLMTLDPVQAAASPLLEMSNYTANLAALQSATPFAGFLTALPDADGVIRSVPLLLRHGNAVYPSLALEAARLFLLQDKIQLQTARIGERELLEHVVLGKVAIPTDGHGRVLVPYRGKAGTFLHVPASDVLHGRADTSLLENGIVILGASALALADLKATPVQSVFPGSEVHASIIAGILDGHFPYVPAWATGANSLLTLGFGLLLALLLPLLGPGRQLLAGLLALAGALYLNFWLWTAHDLALSITNQLTVILVLATFNLAHGFLFESRGRHQLKEMFGQYVPPALVEEMNRDPTHYHADGEQREMSVLFADIRNFTTLSETLDATALKDLLNRFFTPMTRVIFEQRGTIDKYVGDMLMAFWGAPIRDTQHATHAVSAALAMQQAADALRKEFQRLGLPPIHIGIGINSGPMNVGDMGSQYRRAYTVIGDAVNLASRLEGLSKFYGATVLVGEQTRKLAADFIYRPLDRVRVKGKAQTVMVYEVLGTTKALDATLQAELAEHERGLQHLWSRDWDAAGAIFTRLAESHPEQTLYDLYLQRIAHLRTRELPEDWDGSIERREK